MIKIGNNKFEYVANSEKYIFIFLNSKESFPENLSSKDPAFFWRGIMTYNHRD